MITKLDSHTIQRISSGQVILDIPTTLKELIENAIDANSTQINLTIEDDGLTSLSCRDNGIGIRVDDRRYFGQRHATSKISSFEDIDSVRSYGFRGEAIASLCVIGNVFLTTRVEGEETARTYEFDHNGNIISEKASAGQRGTTITVLSLFRGTPVRLAQLKKHRLSLGKVKSLVMTYAFVREVRFSLQVRGNKRLNWTVQASSDAMGVLTSVYGKDFMQRYTNLSWSSDGITIEGILPNSKDGSSKLGNTNVDTTVLDKQLQTHYIYIDNRPVSLTRNPAKQFLKLLCESYPSGRNLQSSFIHLNLHCEVDKVKYDCNMDPSKSEVIFEKFEVVCECFKRFLYEVYGMSSMRSPSPVPVDFFAPARGSNRLLSPPPSSPVLPARNLYSVEENSPDKTTPQKNLRQTLLDEYRSPHIPMDRTNQGTLSFVNERPSGGDAVTLRSMMGCGSEFDEIDLTRGIISSRQPRQTTNPEGNELLNAFRARFDMNGHHPTDAMQKQPSSRDTRNFTKQLSTPRKATERVVRSPRTPGIQKSVRQELSPQSPPSSHSSIKFRSISESPGLEISLNPWTISALNRDPKRARLEMIVPRQMSLHGDDDVFLQTIQPDMDLQTIVVVCEISMEEVAAGHVILLSGIPPACDLMDILLQYYHDFEISTR